MCSSSNQWPELEIMLKFFEDNIKTFLDFPWESLVDFSDLQTLSRKWLQMKWHVKSAQYSYKSCRVIPYFLIYTTVLSQNTSNLNWFGNFEKKYSHKFHMNMFNKNNYQKIIRIPKRESSPTPTPVNAFVTLGRPRIHHVYVEAFRSTRKKLLP